MADLRKQKRASRLSIAISVVFHATIIGVLTVIAAREGMLGKPLQKFAVTIVAKEKPPEKPKEKPPEPKPDTEKPKIERPSPVPVQTLPEAARPLTAPPPAAVAVAPSAAPPPAALPAFDFEGGKTVETTSDPNVIFKGYLEYTLRSRWNRPEGVADEHYVAEVELAVDRDGRVLSTTWKKGSGDAAWDNSVKKALAETPNIGRSPPKGFPEQVLVRFDVQVATEIPLE
jgi:periplasmic protein TonB